jgi:hypothetical protein
MNKHSALELVVDATELDVVVAMETSVATHTC